jgi:hypothetical protein
LKDGNIINGQIVNKTKRKITYIMCCEDWAVPREIKRKNIDTIFFAELEPKENEVNQRDSIPFLQFQKKGSLIQALKE